MNEYGRQVGEVAVLTPYRSQLQLLRSVFRQRGGGEMEAVQVGGCPPGKGGSEAGILGGLWAWAFAGRAPHSSSRRTLAHALHT